MAITDETRQKMSLAAKRTLNGFKKGHKSFIKHHSDETKKKMSEIAKQQGRKPNFSGRKHTEESKEKMRKAALGKKGFWKGKKRPEMQNEEYRKKVSQIMKKKVAEGKHNFWKGGLTVKNKLLRTRLEYKLWRESVFKRDNWTCGFCGQRGGKLEADHIKPFALYPELRYAIDNGRTLCKNCHQLTPTYGRGTIKLIELKGNATC